MKGEMFMEKKMTDLTDLQLTMALILNDRGISLEEQRGKRVTIDTNSISVEEKKYGSDWHSTTRCSVSIDEEAQTISITSNSCLAEGITPLAFDESLNRWHEIRKNIDETYQIFDGKVQYSKTTRCRGSREDDLGGGVPGEVHIDEETATYELPDGYRITDGIGVFSNQKVVKEHKKSGF